MVALQCGCDYSVLKPIKRESEVAVLADDAGTFLRGSSGVAAAIEILREIIVSSVVSPTRIFAVAFTSAT